VICQKLLKKLNETSEVLLTFGPIDRCAATLALLFVSFQIKSYTMPCCLAVDRKPQLEEIVVSNFEIINNKRIFAAAGRMFSLIDVV